MKRAVICLIFVLSLFSVSFAQDEKEKEKKPQAPEFKPEFPKEILSSTKHTVSIGGKSVSYTATAGNILLKEEDGRPKANFFFIAYVKDGVEDTGKTPSHIHSMEVQDHHRFGFI